MTYQTGLKLWQTSKNDFADWALTACKPGSDGITLDPQLATRQTDTSAAGSADARPRYNGGQYFVGEAESPVTKSEFSFCEAIPSWNTSTPPGTWIETLLRVQVNGQWTGWYSLGVWTNENTAVTRHSVNGQKDDNASVFTDTLVLKKVGTAYQIKIRLFSASLELSPTLRNFGLTVSNEIPEQIENTPSCNPACWGKPPLDVPECSQMVYPDGGNVWCSPVSVSMVHGFWQKQTGNCEPRIRHAVERVYDHVYDGHGNWAFNIAYAGELGYTAFIARYTSLADLESWIEQGIPLIMSVAWNKTVGKPLDNAPIEKSDGHLTVLVGFDAQGNPIMNEPAAERDEEVRRLYQRAQLEGRWLEGSGGMVYVIYPNIEK